MSLLAWQKIAEQKEEVENQIKNINNQIMSSKLTDELGQIKFTKMFKPVTSRLDTQTEATKKLENKGLKGGEPPPPIDEDEMPDFEPPPPIDEDEMPDFEPPPPIDEDEMPDFEPPPPIDEDEMPDFEPPPPIDEDEMPDFEPPPPIDEDEMPDFEPPPPIDDDEMPDFEPPPPIDEDEMPDFEPPPPIDEDEMPDFEPPPPIDEDEMPDFEPPPPIDDDEMPDFEPPPPIDEDEMPDFERKRKEWDPSSIKKSKQKELDKERRVLAEERRQVNALLGKLLKSGETYIKSGKYQGASYDELLRKSENFTKQIDRIEDRLLLTGQKKQRMEYKKVLFSASELREKSKKLKKTPRKTKSKIKPDIEKSLFDKIYGMRRGTAPDSDREENEWEGSGLDQNYKVIYYNNPEKLIEKLDVICGSINAGNSSNEVRNQGITILDELLKLKRITKRIHEKIYNNYFI